MRTWAKGTARAALLTTGFVALGAGVAQADVAGSQSGLLNGNNVNLPVSAPVNVSGNAAGVAGDAKASSKGGASVKNKSKGGSGSGSGDTEGVGNGNDVNAPINAPVNVCGNAVGEAAAECKGGAKVENKGKGGSGSGSGDTSGVGNGNDVNAPVNAPVNVCGNAVGVAGDAAAKCKGGAKVENEDKGGYGESGHSGSGDTSGVGNGNDVNAPVNAPVNICGNAVGVAGDAAAKCKGGAKVENKGKGGSGSGSGDTEGVGNNNRVNAPVTAPVNVCGNAVSVLGDAASACSVSFVLSNNPAPPASGSTGTEGALNGNQVLSPVTLPINVCGNAIAILGESSASCGDVPHKPEKPEKPGEPPGETPGGDETPGGETPGGKPDTPEPDNSNDPTKIGGEETKPVAASSNNADELPFTGLNVGSLLALALGAITAGGACVVAASRRLRPSRR